MRTRGKRTGNGGGNGDGDGDGGRATGQKVFLFAQMMTFVMARFEMRRIGSGNDFQQISRICDLQSGEQQIAPGLPRLKHTRPDGIVCRTLAVYMFSLECCYS
jgi:hypothetical protein